jgi:hypothetical protein
VSALIALQTKRLIAVNYYMHGGDAHFDYQQHFDVFVFLTETLEFIFAASELVECGWDIRSWKASRSGITNPIGHYLINYRPLLAMLKTAMSRERATERRHLTAQPKDVKSGLLVAEHSDRTGAAWSR